MPQRASSNSESPKQKKISPRNKTLQLSEAEIAKFRSRIFKSARQWRAKGCPNGTFNGDFLELLPHMPESSVSLLILDPPYNLNKKFKGSKFSKLSENDYEEWLSERLALLKPKLKLNASIYICGDWFSSISIYKAAAKYFKVRNRISWEREKGRGAKANWKNATEDIWFCTMSDNYTFNLDKVKLRRKVIAPYRHTDGKPKDWDDTKSGAFRDTHPSNLWTDISIPFWSMPENTEHPTQKSEKLLARLILASSNEGDLVFDPFLGSGSSSVVAKKLNRNYLGAEIEESYCLLAEKRLELAESEKRIQGLVNGVFFERNTLAEQLAKCKDHD
ncbi:MAG: site-specific DNA-methyltransferase [Candidatus Obscuribacterales bacterium]|nr:site-specific DNA-methyltransferase [Candidatus Obscuribacterales bacterium]